MGRTPLWAHRGFSGRYPENTMLAYVAAIEAGADGIELDVHQTADDEFVVMHDSTVDRTTNGRGRIADMTWREIVELDCGDWLHPAFRGTRVPRLEDVLALLAIVRPVVLNIEWKMDLSKSRKLEHIFELIVHHGLSDRVIHSSFRESNLSYIKNKFPKAKTALLVEEGLQKAMERAVALGVEALHPDYRDITPLYVRRAHQVHLAVHPYTVDSPNAFAWMEECQVDAVITNWPGEKWLKKRPGEANEKL